MEEALKQLCADVEEAVRGGLEIVVLSDRIGKEDMDIETPPIPTLLAVGAVHHHLIRCASMHFRAADALCISIMQTQAMDALHWSSACNCLGLASATKRRMFTPPPPPPRRCSHSLAARTMRCPQ